MRHLTKTEFDEIEGIFHDGLGTFAEVELANELISLLSLEQVPFNNKPSIAKMKLAISKIPTEDSRSNALSREIGHIAKGAKEAASVILSRIAQDQIRHIHHTPRAFQNAQAADLRIELENGLFIPVSVKTDKSRKAAVAEGQTPDVYLKWAQRYFSLSKVELEEILKSMKIASIEELKRSHYQVVSRFVALTLIRQLGLNNCELNNFSHAQVTNLPNAKRLFRQLLKFKSGADDCLVIVIDRLSGGVRWESLLDSVDIEELGTERITFTPCKPRKGAPVASTFGVRIDGKTVVTFQVKHQRGKNKTTDQKTRFLDITTRLNY